MPLFWTISKHPAPPPLLQTRMERLVRPEQALMVLIIVIDIKSRRMKIMIMVMEMVRDEVEVVVAAAVVMFEVGCRVREELLQAVDSRVEVAEPALLVDKDKVVVEVEERDERLDHQ